MPSVKIAGTGHATPAWCVDNDEVERSSSYNRAERGGISLDAWARKNHGGSRRYVAREEATADLALLAGQRALQAAGLQADALDLIVLATFTGDHILPQAVGAVQAGLGTKARCLQLHAACSGFIDALSLAADIMNCGQARNALVMSGDILSRYCNPKDFVTRSVFGDAAGAAVLLPCGAGETGLAGKASGTDGDIGHYVFIPAGGSRQPIDQDGLDKEEDYWRFRFSDIHHWALERFEHASHLALAQAGLTIEDIALIIPHQASSRLIGELTQRLGVSRDKVVDIFPDYGNISGASIPVALDLVARENRLSPGDWLLLPAVGAGMAWGAAVMRWELSNSFENAGVA